MCGRRGREVRPGLGAPEPRKPGRCRRSRGGWRSPRGDVNDGVRAAGGQGPGEPPRREGLCPGRREQGFGAPSTRGRRLAGRRASAWRPDGGRGGRAPRAPRASPSARLTGPLTPSTLPDTPAHARFLNSGETRLLGEEPAVGSWGETPLGPLDPWEGEDQARTGRWRPAPLRVPEAGTAARASARPGLHARPRPPASPPPHTASVGMDPRAPGASGAAAPWRKSGAAASCPRAPGSVWGALGARATRPLPPAGQGGPSEPTSPRPVLGSSGCTCPREAS